MTPLSITADKLVAAQVYTTPDDTEVGDKESVHLLGLAASLQGGSDDFCCGTIKASDGIYLEVLENGSGSDSDSAIFTVSYVEAINYPDNYPDVGIWRAQYWDAAPGRNGTTFAHNYESADFSMTGVDESSADGQDDSGAGGQQLEADSSRTFLTDEMLSTLRTGIKDD